MLRSCGLHGCVGGAARRHSPPSLPLPSAWRAAGGWAFEIKPEFSEQTGGGDARVLLDHHGRVLAGAIAAFRQDAVLLDELASLLGAVE